MVAKKHTGHPHLTGEHPLGDMGQLVLFLMFMGTWVTDSFFFHYSTFLAEKVAYSIRISLAGLVLIAGWYLARGGMKAVFGTAREKPEVISTGVFRIVRHPIYTGAILFYLSAILSTFSLASAVLWLLITGFYIYISRYEESILSEAFGEEYLKYKKNTGMLFPKFKT